LLKGESIPQPSLLNLDIALDEQQIFTKQDLLLVRLVESQPEEFAERGQCFLSRPRITAQERGDRIERIEQKMRLQLGLQGMQTGLRQVRLQQHCAPLALARAAVKVDGMHETCQRTISQDIQQTGEQPGIVPRGRMPTSRRYRFRRYVIGPESDLPDQMLVGTQIRRGTICGGGQFP